MLERIVWVGILENSANFIGICLREGRKEMLFLRKETRMCEDMVYEIIYFKKS